MKHNIWEFQYKAFLKFRMNVIPAYVKTGPNEQSRLKKTAPYIKPG
jgi:hypothetical protein